MLTASAGARWLPNAYAISSRWPAYSRGRVPAAITRSSHASSRSMRSRRATHQRPDGTSKSCRPQTPATASGSRTARRAPAREGPRPASVVRPRVGDGRNQDGGTARAEGHRHAALAASQQANRTSDTRCCGAHSLNSRVHSQSLHIGRLAREPPDAPPLPRQVYQHDEQAGRVHAGDDGRPRTTVVRRAARTGADAGRPGADSRCPRERRASARLRPRRDPDRRASGRCRRRRANHHRPIRQRERQHRKQEHAEDGKRPDQVAHRRGRSPVHHGLHDRGDSQQHRRLTTIQRAADIAGSTKNIVIAHLPVRGRVSAELLKRRYSAADSGVDVMSSSAAIAEPG